MKAVVKTYTVTCVIIVEIPYPTLKSGWIIIKVKACGICGSDVAMFYNASSEELGRRLTPQRPYLGMGHEYAGEVVEVGEGVSNVKVGDHVTVCPWFQNACGKCRDCLSGRSWACRSPVMMGGGGGAMAEYTTAPATFVHQLPSNLTWDDGALIEPFTITFAAAYSFSSFRIGQTAAILGPGPIGLLTLAALNLSTPSLTIVTGTDADVSLRLPLAKKLGADITINSSKEDAVKRVMELTEGRGVDYVYEAAGVPLLSQGLQMLTKGGEYTAIGHAHGETRPIRVDSSDYWTLQRKWAKVNGMILEKRDVWYTVIDILKTGKVDIKPVITHHVSIDDAQKGFELMRTQNACKVIVNP